MARRDLDETRHQLETLVRLLPGAVANDLLTEARRGQLGQNVRVQILRASLMSYLSARRPDKMRRAFTKPLEPYLVDEDWLVLSSQDVPGLISRLDAGALWATAGGYSTDAYAAERLSKISAQAEAAGFFETNESLVVHEAASYVANQIDHAAGDKTTLYEWLQAFNTARAAAADAVGKANTGLRPRNQQWLVWVADVLSAGETLSRHFVNLRSQFWAAGAPLDPERGMGMLNAIRAALDIDLAREGLRSTLADMVPAVALNLSLNYGAVGELIRRAGSRADTEMAAQAMNAHVVALIGAIDRTLGSANGEMPREIFLDLLQTALAASKRAGLNEDGPRGALDRLTLRTRSNPAHGALTRRLETFAY